MPRLRRLVWLAAAAAVVGSIPWAVREHHASPPEPAPPRASAAQAQQPAAGAPPRVAAGPLTAGAVRELARNTVHAYPVRLRAGESLHLTVEQLRLDVEVRLFDPEGRRLLHVDSPRGAVGTEELWFVAAASGEHRVEIAAWGGAAGRYRLAAVSRRPATPEDRRRAEALAAFSHGRDLDGPATAGEAAAAYQRAADLWRGRGEDSFHLEARRRLGDLLAGIKGAPGEAIPIYQEILTADQQTGDRRGQALMNSHLAQCYLDLNRPVPARAAAERALAAWRRVGDREGIAKALHILGEASRRQGDLRSALHFFAEALEKSNNPSHRIQALIGLGIALAAAGDEAAAQERCTQAMSLLQGRGEAGVSAQALTQLGNVLFDMGEPYKALSVLKEAWLVHRRSNSIDRRDLAVILASLGRVYFKLSDGRRAKEYQKKALQLFMEAGGGIDEGSAWNNLGWIALFQRSFQEALDAFQHALLVGRGHHSRELAATALLGMARAERERGNPIAGRARVEGALDIIEAMRGELIQPDLQMSFLAKKEDYYGYTIDLLMEQYHQQPTSDGDLRAFAVSERSRSRALLDRLSRTGAPPRLLSLPEVQHQILDDDTVLLEYYLREPKSYLWVVSQGSAASFELAGRGTLERQARQTLAALSRRGSSPVVVELRLAELGRSLLGPVAGQLGDKRLLVVPHGALQAVPFSVLSDPGVKGGGFSPLLLRHEVVVLPSASVLAALRRRADGRRTAEGKVALIGEPVLSADDPLLPAAARNMPGPLEDGPFEPLPFARQEIDAITALVPSRDLLRLLGFEANRERVMGDRLAGYGTLHFVTHGVFDEEHPDRSALVLSRFNPAGGLRRGLLRAEDIEAMRLRADLVVLSACETARGREVRGEGVVGLTRSFLAAGADRVLVSLWKVDDRATAVLMERFYQQLLGEGRPPAAALREAQLSMWREERWRRPYQWAGFLLQGIWD